MQAQQFPTFTNMQGQPVSYYGYPQQPVQQMPYQQQQLLSQLPVRQGPSQLPVQQQGPSRLPVQQGPSQMPVQQFQQFPQQLAVQQIPAQLSSQRGPVLGGTQTAATRPKASLKLTLQVTAPPNSPVLSTTQEAQLQTAVAQLALIVEPKMKDWLASVFGSNYAQPHIDVVAQYSAKGSPMVTRTAQLGAPNTVARPAVTQASPLYNSAINGVSLQQQQQQLQGIAVGPHNGLMNPPMLQGAGMMPQQIGWR